jgi:hypothetical protein
LGGYHGVDALSTRIIIDYEKRDDPILMSAGSLVAEHFVAKGFVKGAIRNCPAGCTSKTGSSFSRRLPEEMVAGRRWQQ